MASAWWWLPRLQWRACVCLDDEGGIERKNLKIFWRVKSETDVKDELTAEESELIAVLLRSCSQVIASAIWQKSKTPLRDDFDITREEQDLIKLLHEMIPTTLNQLLIEFGYDAFNKAEAEAKAEAIAHITQMQIQLEKLDNLNKHLLAGNQVLKMVEANSEAETIDQLIKINLDETLLNQFQPRPELKNMTVYDLQAIEEYMAVLIDEARKVLNQLLSASAAVVETTEEQQPVQSEVHEALNLKPQDGALQDTELTSIKTRKVRRGTRGGGRKINYKKTPEGQTKISDTLTEHQIEVTEKPNSKPLDKTKVEKEELPNDEKVEAPRDPQKPFPKRKEGRKEMPHWTLKQVQRIPQASVETQNNLKTGGDPTVLKKSLPKQEVEESHRAKRSTQAPQKKGNDGRRPWRATTLTKMSVS